MSTNKNMPFIATTDRETADKLIDAGLHLVSDTSNRYVFANYDTLNFTDLSKMNIDKSKTTFTNLLCM